MARRSTESLFVALAITGRAHGDLVKALIEAGKFNWQAFNGNQVGDGSGPTVTRANCLAFMRDYCRPARQQRTLRPFAFSTLLQSCHKELSGGAEPLRPGALVFTWGAATAKRRQAR